MNFETPLAKNRGIVYGPTDPGGSDLVLEQSINKPGHVVCLTGYHPDPNDPGEGWFTFRNSRGTSFGGAGPTPDKFDVPDTIAKGFGCISSRYIDDYCWEFYSPSPLI